MVSLKGPSVSRARLLVSWLFSGFEIEFHGFKRCKFQRLRNTSDAQYKVLKCALISLVLCLARFQRQAMLRMLTRGTSAGARQRPYISSAAGPKKGKSK